MSYLGGGASTVSETMVEPARLYTLKCLRESNKGSPGVASVAVGSVRHCGVVLSIAEGVSCIGVGTAMSVSAELASVVALVCSLERRSRFRELGVEGGTLF